MGTPDPSPGSGGPALTCPGCGSPDVDLRRGLFCGTCAETPALPPDAGQPEARAICEHFYASHCYRGMSIRLCMMCHEPDWDDLERQLREAACAETILREAAEAKLSEIRSLAQNIEGRFPLLPVVPAKEILAITGSEDEARDGG